MQDLTHEGSRALGAKYCDARRRQYTVDRRTRRLDRLGERVPLAPVAAFAA
jgi:hypothetical protein